MSKFEIDVVGPAADLILNSAKTCFICKQEFKDHSDKHLHHDHSEEKGNTVAVACARCNLAMKDSIRKDIPIVFHNRARYDWKLFMEHVGEFLTH